MILAATLAVILNAGLSEGVENFVICNRLRVEVICELKFSIYKYFKNNV